MDLSPFLILVRAWQIDTWGQRKQVHWQKEWRLVDPWRVCEGKIVHQNRLLRKVYQKCLYIGICVTEHLNLYWCLSRFQHCALIKWHLWPKEPCHGFQRCSGTGQRQGWGEGPNWICFPSPCLPIVWSLLSTKQAVFSFPLQKQMIQWRKCQEYQAGLQDK